MDIALKTLVLIVFILVPGFLFRRVYFQGTFSKQFDSKTWSHSLFYSALFGIILNFLAYNCYEHLLKEIDYKACLSFYNSITKDSIPEKDLVAFDIKSIYKYLGILYGLAVIVAWIIYLIVRNFKLDRYFAPLRFSDHWHYYFKGEIKDFKEFSLSKGRCSVVTADVLVKSEKDGNNIYSGLLSSYSLDDKGGLESISLTKAQIFKQDKKEFKDIHSTIFIIPNSSILNINLRYTFLEEDDTIIDFITLTIYIVSLIFLWIDFQNIFTEYNFISKIFLKLIGTVACLFFPVFIDALYRFVSFNSKPQIKPKGVSAKEIEQIDKVNNNKKIKKKDLGYDILIAIALGVIFFGILLSILWITY